MLTQPTIDTLNRLKVHGMALALAEHTTTNAAQGLAFGSIVRSAVLGPNRFK